MKIICVNPPRIARFAMLALFFMFCCADPGGEVGEPEVPGQGGEEEEEEEDTLTPEEADAVLEAFVFISAKKVTGSPPAVSNTALTKTSSKDTIYVVPEVQDVIRISHPASTHVKGVFIKVTGSTFYYDVEMERKEASDTVSVTFIDIDPLKIEGEFFTEATSVPVEIMPYDDQGEPIDIIERTLTIEKPGSGCNILGHTWFWEWSAMAYPTGPPYNLNCQGERNRNDFIFKDCCLGVPACPVYDENGDPIYDVEIPISLYYTIATEWLRFGADGLFERQTVEYETYISNPGEDPYTFNPCDWTPEISRRVEAVNYYGTHDYVPGDDLITYLVTDTSCKPGEIGCGFGGSVVGARVITTCHILALIRSNGEGKSVRKFSRGDSDLEDEILERETFWN
jgi:hypothetical protein